MLFEDDSDPETGFKTNNEYAKSYDTWRKKEELNKLKTKYGDDVDLLDESSSSSSDDEDGIELTEAVEKDFFKTLACLKNKDPRIYDKNVKFFGDKAEAPAKKPKKEKEKPMYIKDYERKLLLEKGGVPSDEEEADRPRSPTYVEEQKQIKDKLKQALAAVDEDEDGDWGGIFKERKKTTEENEAEEVHYKKWLAGREKEMGDKQTEVELKPLKDYWNRPDLDEGEKFLRDYILNKKFLENDNDDYVPTYDEIIHDSDQDLSNDEDAIEKQEEFEHKYNFRFEEPDPEFIKRFPRTVENSVRKTDDRRKVKRQEVKARKKKEKEEKIHDLKQLQELKRKEIEEKLEKLKEITGNPSIGFEDQDLDGEFDPEEHDKKMQALFNEEFYGGPEEEQKPEFPDLDEELEIENWERYNATSKENEATVPHCEDEDFNMDCDYDPQVSTQNELIETTKRKGKKKRKSRFAEAVSKPKPKFDPSDKNYEKYFDEYYKLDCEDFIGDIACRFKYRDVVPNDFGLSIEEILLAKERELNKWCSLKKSVQIRPDHVERYEQIAYMKKGQNINLKHRILPSLFTPDPDDEKNGEENENNANTKTHVSNIDDSTKQASEEKNEANMKHPKSKKKKKTQRESNNLEQERHLENTQSRAKPMQLSSTNDILDENTKPLVVNGLVKKNKKKKKGNTVQPAMDSIDNENKDHPVANKLVNKKKKNKLSAKTNKKLGEVSSKKKEQHSDPHTFKNTPSGTSDNKAVAGKTKNKVSEGSNDVSGKSKKRKHKDQKSDNAPAKKRFKKENDDQNPMGKISDSRLLAYGIKPKKFKNKLKYQK